MSKYDVFISYSSKDKDVASFVCDELEKRDLKCWIAPRNEVAGISYAKQILQAISESSVFVVCFSQNANQSEHVESEIDNAFTSGKIIIPFRIDDCVMSPEMKYYLNKKHWLSGMPIDETAIENLAQSIISNIPERAKSREIENSIDNAISMVEDIIKKSNDASQAHDMSLDSTYQSRLEKLKSLNQLVDHMDVSIKVGSAVQEFVAENKDFLLSQEGNGRHHVFVNDDNELMFFVKRMPGDACKASLIYDGTQSALLRKNAESAYMLDLESEVISRLKHNTEVLICEIDVNGLVSEFKARVRFQYDLKDLPEYHGIDQDIMTEPCSDNRYDILQNHDGSIMVLVKAQKGRPSDSVAVFYDKTLLLMKNTHAAFKISDIAEQACSILSQIDDIIIVEMYDDIAVAKYKARLLKPGVFDWSEFDVEDVFVPRPLDLSDIIVSEDDALLADSISQYVHAEDAWKYYSDGWTQGDNYDEVKKTTPVLKEFYKLDDKTKSLYNKNIINVFKMLYKLGYEITPKKSAKE